MKLLALFNKYIFVFIFLFLFFFNSINIIDRSGQYWFSLALVNLFLFFYLYFKNSLNQEFIKYFFFKDKIIRSYIIFLIFIFISFIFSLNLSESIVVSFRYLTTFCSIFLLFFYLNNSSFKIFSLIISAVFLLQLSFTFSGYLSIITKTVYSFEFANFLAGIGANKNITAALFCMQLPFVYYLLLKFKNYFLKFAFSFLLAFSFYNIYVLGSRTALIIIIAQSLLLIFLAFYYRTKFISINKYPLRLLFNWFLPLFLSLTVFSTSIQTSSNASLVSRVSSISLDNGSVNERLKFYGYTIDYILNNHFLPLGIGNWKIFSVDWDSNLLVGYTVAYHAHNDFLELAAEISVIGALFYLLVFIYAFFSIFKSITASKSFYEIGFLVALLLSGTAFFIDSFLNFPNSRPIQVIIFVFALTFVVITNFKRTLNE